MWRLFNMRKPGFIIFFATILFIAHQLPKGLAVDEVFTLIGEKATQMRLVEEERIGDS